MRARRIGRAYRWASSRWVIRVAATVATGGAAGWACAWIGTPIPWMLGPLFAVAILRVAGVPLEAPQPLRYTGQWIIGTALGLYFTPAVLREVVGWYREGRDRPLFEERLHAGRAVTPEERLIRRASRPARRRKG